MWEVESARAGGWERGLPIEEWGRARVVEASIGGFRKLVERRSLHMLVVGTLKSGVK